LFFFFFFEFGDEGFDYVIPFNSRDACHLYDGVL